MGLNKTLHNKKPFLLMNFRKYFKLLNSLVFRTPLIINPLFNTIFTLNTPDALNVHI